MSQKLLIKIPSRERPKVLDRVVRRYAELIEDRANTLILLSMDLDDQGSAGVVAGFGDLDIEVHGVRAARCGKIGAVNRDQPDDFTWDIVLLGSDDMFPQVQALDRIIRQDMASHWPEGDGCLWYGDGQQARLCTYPVMDRKYWERDRHIYHPGYKSYFADDEQTELALMRSRMARCAPVLLKHEHPCWNGQVSDDGLYRHNRLFKGADRDLFRQRKAAGFP